MQDQIKGTVSPPTFAASDFRVWLKCRCARQSMAAVSRQFGVNESTIYRWVHGSTIPPMALILGGLLARQDTRNWPEMEE
ncbi:MAG: hypothetical protein ACYCOU_00040 [Sulfobacillus sp.]